MSLRDWDRKSQVLKDELKVLAGETITKGCSETEKKIELLQKNLSNADNKLAAIYSYIGSQSSRIGLFSKKEKAILHWASEYAHKAKFFFRNFSKDFHEVFWAKLVQLRCESVVYHAHGTFFESKKKRKENVQRHQKKLLETRDKLRSRLKNIESRQERLAKKYDFLAIAKSNFQSVCLVKVGKKHIEHMQQFTWTKEQWNSVLPEDYLKKEALKIGSLTTDPKREAIARDLLKYQTKRRPHPIKSFDYLQLDETHTEP